MKKVLICLFSVILLSAGATFIYGQGMMMLRGGYPMNHHFMHARNLQLLKWEQAERAMIHFSESLNVKCNFCHNVDSEVSADYIRRNRSVKGDFAGDLTELVTDENLRKPLRQKSRAREMLKMVNYDNKNFMNWKHTSGRTADQVNCWLCHRGQHDEMVSEYKLQNKDFIDLY